MPRTRSGRSTTGRGSLRSGAERTPARPRPPLVKVLTWLAPQCAQRAAAGAQFSTRPHGPPILLKNVKVQNQEVCWGARGAPLFAPGRLRVVVYVDRSVAYASVPANMLASDLSAALRASLRNKFFKISSFSRDLALTDGRGREFPLAPRRKLPRRPGASGAGGPLLLLLKKAHSV